MYGVRNNQSNYRRVYEEKPKEMEALEASEDEPRLSDLVQDWEQQSYESNSLFRDG